MFNKISRLLSQLNKSPRKTYSAKGTNVDRPQGAQCSGTVDSFLSSISELGHTEYPILSKQYSPNSRIPCCDLVPFVSNLIDKGDVKSIKMIMEAVIEANPGLGCDASWIADKIDDALLVPFEKYVTFSSEAAMSQLKALFIIAVKDGSLREFQITSGLPRLISWACVIDSPSWSKSLNSLIPKANSWISDIAKDTPYWEEYEQFTPVEFDTPSISEDLRAIITELTPAARFQLFFAVQRESGALLELTNYLIRSFGIDVESTSKELTDRELLLPSLSREVIQTTYSKQELAEMCLATGVTSRKSWNKTKLLNALEEHDRSIVAKLSISKSIVSPNPKYKSELLELLEAAEVHELGFKLLCFA